MKIRLFLPFLVFLIAAQDTPLVAITAPTPDELLRGQATITGAINFPSFLSAQLEFAYASNPTNTWFPIQTFSAPLNDPTLAVWDTTLITDGDYVLRLRVNFEDVTSQ